MSATVKRGTYHRSCLRCPWTGTYDTAARADYAKRRHSCDRWTNKAASANRGAARAASVDRTPKPCHHKYADHQHGTYACYTTLDTCRCEPCATAQHEYEQNRVRQQAYGRWDNLIDAEPVRNHVRRLMAAGMGLQRIGAAADVSTGVMWKLLYGKPPKPGRTRTPSKRVTKAVANRLLAVELDLADGAMVPNTDTSRRLQALVANGWSMSKLGARLGIQAGNFNPVITGRRQVTVATAKAVHALYLELADVAPPETGHRDKIAASRARNYAANRGWVPPLRINGRLVVGTVLPLPELDDADVIQLDAPAFDEAAVDRRLNGDRTAPVTKADRIEIVRRARDLGWSYLDIERRTGITKPERYITAGDTEVAS